MCAPMPSAASVDLLHLAPDRRNERFRSAGGANREGHRGYRKLYKGNVQLRVGWSIRTPRANVANHAHDLAPLTGVGEARANLTANDRGRGIAGPQLARQRFGDHRYGWTVRQIPRVGKASGNERHVDARIVARSNRADFGQRRLFRLDHAIRQPDRTVAAGLRDWQHVDGASRPKDRKSTRLNSSH